MIATQQVADLLPKLEAFTSWEQQAVPFDDAAGLVFDIPSDCDQTRSRDKNGPGSLALFAPDLHFSVPATLTNSAGFRASF